MFCMYCIRHPITHSYWVPSSLLIRYPTKFWIRDTLKLQKQKTWIKHGIQYHKWVVVIPESIVNDLGWKEKIELDARARQGKLMIEKK